jgi:phage terminase large subunit-like protein
VMTRLEDASVMVIHTRWHEDDLIGRLAKDGGWEVVNLPAIAGPDDPLGRQLGEPLWPEERPLRMLEEQRALDAFNFEALYQGQPRPRGARVFGPATYYDPASFDMTGWRITIYADPAASEKTSANYSAILALATTGRGAEMRGRVVDVYRRQVTIPQFVRDLQAFQAANGNAEACVESVAGFKAVAQMLREIDPHVRVREVRPLGDKFQRAQPAASAWNGVADAIDPTRNRPPRLEVPLRAPWLKAFLDEVGAFTGVHDASDDQVDCLSGTWNEADKTVPFTAPPGPLIRMRR